MGPDDPIFAREQRSNPFENPTIPLSASYDDWLGFFGVSTGKASLPRVTIESALEVPAVLLATSFLSRTLSTLPLHTYRKSTSGELERVDDDVAMLLGEAPNPEWTSSGWRRYVWQQVFTGGRGPTWIERSGTKVVALWPMDPNKTTVRRQGGRKIYHFENKEYPAADVVDVPFMLKPNQLEAYGPIAKGAKAIALAIAMNDFAGAFFASGGVPPLALEGPLPQGVDGFRRAQVDIQRAIDLARQSGSPFFGMPPGHALKAIGIDPEKGQMTEARLFQNLEVGRLWGLPPVFLLDLSHGTFSNTEQQDLQLVKHLILHWAHEYENELRLKLYGQHSRGVYVRHNLDAIQRGDFKSRIEAIARGIQTSQLTPDEGRALENRGPKPGGDKLYIQGATVPIEMAGTQAALKAAASAKTNNGDEGDDDAGDKPKE